MKINVKVLPSSSAESIEKIDEITYKVKVSASAQEGRANKRLRELLAQYFKVSKGNVNIIAGERSKVKIIEIINNKI